MSDEFYSLFIRGFQLHDIIQHLFGLYAYCVPLPSRSRLPQDINQPYCTTGLLVFATQAKQAPALVWDCRLLC